MSKSDQQELQSKNRQENWLDLANHFQIKVHKRTSEVAFLQTKAGFLIAAAVIVLQVITGLPKFNTGLEVTALCLAVLFAFASLVMAIVSMHIGKSTTPLNPDKMMLDLAERPIMTREEFANWLAKSYAKANKDFNSEYSRKYTQQIIAASLLVASFAIIIILKGINIYV